jgi:type II secretory pathway pseudopilin PulG
MRVAAQRGIALLVTLLLLSVLAAVAAGVTVSFKLARSSTTHQLEAADVANAAESALELAARELAAIADWDAVLNGARASGLVDGAPGVRVVPGGETIDLARLTNELTCGRAALCTDAQVQAFDAERPWGVNNARWRPFLHVELPRGPAMPHPRAAAYVAVWIGDDAREIDGNSMADGAGGATDGRYVVRARVEAFGPRGARYGLEAELVRVCQPAEAAEVCAPGVRIQNWRAAAPRP